MSDGQKNTSGVAVKLLLSLLIFVVPLEIAVRVLTKDSGIGMPYLSNMALLPFIPGEAEVRKWFEARKNDDFMVLDPELGWTNKPDGKNGIYESNSQAARTPKDRVFAAKIPNETVRVMGIGDSFMAAEGVKYEDTWAAQLEKLGGKLEALNYGVSGYGTDQAYLRYQRRSKGMELDAAVLGIWPDNLFRNLNTNIYYKAPISPSLMPKPRFLLEEGDKLKLVRFPVPKQEQLIQELIKPNGGELVKYEHWIKEGEVEFKPWYHLHLLRVASSVLSKLGRKGDRQRQYDDGNSLASRTGVAIAKAFAKEAKAKGQKPLILIFPSRGFIGRYQGEFGWPAAKALKDAGLEVIDLQPLANQADANGINLFLDDGHLNERGNKKVAEALWRALKDDLEKTRQTRIATYAEEAAKAAADEGEKTEEATKN